MSVWRALLGIRRYVPEPKDQFWMSRRHRLAAIGHDVAARLADSALVLIVSHFPLSLVECQRSLAACSLPHQVWERRLDAQGVVHLVEQNARPHCLLVPATALVPGEAAHEPLGPRCVAIIVVERHPLFSRDQAITQFAESLPFARRLVFHASLDQPVMGGLRDESVEWWLHVFSMLRIPESNPRCGPTVARKVEKRQRQIEARAIGDAPAESADEWLRLNCPDFAKWR